MPTPLFAASAQFAIIVASVVILTFVLRRRYSARWSWWAAGVLAFVASLLRLPLLAAVNAYAPGLALAVALLSSGLFEEGARFLVMHRLARSVRDWPSAVMFGAGHGGVEAILIFSFALINTAVLLLNGDALIAQIQTTAPAQAEALRTQIALLNNTPLWQFALGAWERVPALLLHITASILVMRAVRDHDARFLFAAIALHIALNTLAVLTQQQFGVIAAEAALTIAALGCAWIIFSQRRRDPAEPGAADPAATA
ncbi:MAG: YhfC family glutamic-type intramembrane protease [Chloroflexi bacterium]|nr:YhfC family glutamic-type intramembrane protease [Chloroflexota bacterium]